MKKSFEKVFLLSCLAIVVGVKTLTFLSGASAFIGANLDHFYQSTTTSQYPAHINANYSLVADQSKASDNPVWYVEFDNNESEAEDEQTQHQPIYAELTAAGNFLFTLCFSSLSCYSYAQSARVPKPLYLLNCVFLI